MPDQLRFGRFELRPAERQLLSDGEPVRLGARAFDLLLALVRHPDRLVTKAELLDFAWPGLVVEEANVQVQVSALRKVLGPQALATIPGLGYRLAVPLHCAEALPVPPSDDAAAGTSSPPTNLPVALDELIGRDADLDALQARLDSHRLVTVVGTGGIGKTRLAQAVSRARLGRYPGGVWWVDLAALSSAEQIVPGIAKAVGISLGSGDALAPLLRGLAPRRLLLVLDNCEHLAGALAVVVRNVLQVAAEVQVMATSQEPLRLPGEQLHGLEPLELPPRGSGLAQARSCGATLLLERRAAAVDRRFALSASNVAQAIELCRQLDGLPLAIEMAASRLPLLGFRGLQQQLADRLDRLHAAGRETPPRQQSLRMTMDWSHAMLDAQEQATLRRLAVFTGDFRLEGAQCTASGPDLSQSQVLDVLAGLVERSLVKLVALEPPRYRLLETTRVYAAQRLDHAGETAEVLRRHGAAMAALAEVALDERLDGDASPWLARYLPDYDDLQLAFERACRRDDADVAAVLVAALRLIDQLCGLRPNSGRRVEPARALLAHAGPLARARLHSFIASCGWVAMAPGVRLGSALQAVTAWRELGVKRQLHAALALAATESARVARYIQAERLLQEARELEDAAWPARAVAVRMVHEGWVARFRGAPDRHRDCMRTALALCEQDGEPALAANALVLLASATLAAGDIEEAIALSRLGIERARGGDQVHRLGELLGMLARGLLAAGDLGGARDAARSALAHTEPDAAHHADLMLTVAAWSARLGEFVVAARLLGHACSVHATEAAEIDIVRDRLTAETLAAIATLNPAEAGCLRTSGASPDADVASRLARTTLEREALDGIVPVPVAALAAAHPPRRTARPQAGIVVTTMPSSSA